MDKLDATTLSRWFSNTPLSRYLDPTDVDVKRLRDDRSEIQLGDEVAFVATTAFRLTAEAMTALQDAHIDAEVFRDLGKEDALFSIGADGELVSSSVPLDNDSVSQWIADHYDFQFLLNGAPHAAFGPVGRVRLSPDDATAVQRTLPWIQKLNTAAIKDDYIDVDVKLALVPAPIATSANRFAEYDLPYQPINNTGADLPKARVVLRVPNALLATACALDVALDDRPDGVRLQILFDHAKPSARSTDPSTSSSNKAKQPHKP